MTESMGITNVLHRIREQAEGDEVAVGTLIDALEHRGFGPLLLAPALIALLPTSGIPGVPSVCGLLIFLIAIQGALGKRSPWVPGRLRRLSMRPQTLVKVVDRVQPYTRRIDRWFRPRWVFLTRAPINRIVALGCAVSGLTMIPLELVPFAGTAPALAITLAAIGMSTRDGIMIVVASLAAAGTLALLVTQWPFG
ncbi:hypothetical protein C8D92_101305 [Tamilnaduibacter salinus]|uniref:Exopolysaccharide biosynthesis protein exod n=1 Tax=Tamilnaduibacter salinus TaxID=1484056 RepID=A0A2A2HZC2_9GAMM|nr:exopolysaccharide biosynthesis protein [Tamilnaduibacter salinus]PAV24707.1 exopolysaccharide biosynthesis protein exod [Tamilnaduibacter salinus]PVY79099.1 hypothetical protein C8D92_101305 [Tamilnaduibacter salinus]